MGFTYDEPHSSATRHAAESIHAIYPIHPLSSIYMQFIYIYPRKLPESSGQHRHTWNMDIDEWTGRRASGYQSRIPSVPPPASHWHWCRYQFRHRTLPERMCAERQAGSLTRSHSPSASLSHSPAGAYVVLMIHSHITCPPINTYINSAL